MNCSKVRELLLTDYRDGEVDKKVSSEIESHLKTCSECLEFKCALETIADPFKSAQAVKPPEYLWEKIKSKIETQKPEWDKVAGPIGSAIERFLVFLRSARYVHVPVAAAFGIIAAVRVRSFVDEAIINSYLSEQMQFMESIDVSDFNGLDMPENI